MLKKLIATSLPIPQRLMEILAKRSGVIFKSRRVSIGYLSVFYGNIVVGDNCVFGQNTYISSNCTYSKLVIEDNVCFENSNQVMEGYFPHPPSISKICKGTHIGNNNILDLSGGLHIGKGCLLADEIRIFTHKHEIPSRREPVQTGKIVFKPVVIEDDVFIGIGAKVLCGVKIEKGAIVGAGSVVTHDVKPYTFVAGIPATEKGERKP